MSRYVPIYRNAAAGATPIRQRIAKALTDLLSPIIIVPVLLLAVALRYSPSVLAGVAWAALAALFASAIPLIYILILLRIGRVSDYHVRDREQRRAVGAVVIPSLILGTVILVLLGAPRQLVALASALAAGILMSGLVTLYWKISVHVAAVAGSLMILVLAFGWRMLVLVPTVLLVAWSRIVLRDHTSAQVLAGAILGALTAAVVFTLLR